VFELSGDEVAVEEVTVLEETAVVTQLSHRTGYDSRTIPAVNGSSSMLQSASGILSQSLWSSFPRQNTPVDVAVRVLVLLWRSTLHVAVAIVDVANEITVEKS
jgi:hypothetical protein